MQQPQLLQVSQSEVWLAMRSLLDSDGNMKVLSLAEFQKYRVDVLRAIMVVKGLYVIVTCELIDYLKEQINGKSAIEICAGDDRIGYHLDIFMTDSYLQQTEEMKKLYASMRQPVTTPQSDVLKFDALSAVDGFKPQIVIGSYVTQLYEEGDTEKNIPSSIHGVDEIKLINYPSVEKYIMIGNMSAHRDKRAFALNHTAEYHDFLITRGADQSQNRIFTFFK